LGGTVYGRKPEKGIMALLLKITTRQEITLGVIGEETGGSKSLKNGSPRKKKSSEKRLKGRPVYIPTSDQPFECTRANL